MHYYKQRHLYSQHTKQNCLNESNPSLPLKMETEKTQKISEIPSCMQIKRIACLHKISKTWVYTWQCGEPFFIQEKADITLLWTSRLSCNANLRTSDIFSWYTINLRLRPHRIMLNDATVIQSLPRPARAPTSKWDSRHTMIKREYKRGLPLISSND